ncbi:hypothetical protein B0H14DRAFT_2658366 [Mycena olivaceomarginata]|nr:hypothetical protein B0H14DRAFT_2658366 [Mycena olivaceomarginata]
MTSYTPPVWRSAPRSAARRAALANASSSTPDKEEFETVCKTGNPLLFSLALEENGMGKGAPTVLVARVSPSSGISVPHPISLKSAGAEVVDLGSLTRIRVAALVLPALSISWGRLVELSVGFFLKRGFTLARAASASAMRIDGRRSRGRGGLETGGGDKISPRGTHHVERVITQPRDKDGILVFRTLPELRRGKVGVTILLRPLRDAFVAEITKDSLEEYKIVPQDLDRRGVSRKRGRLPFFRKAVDVRLSILFEWSSPPPCFGAKLLARRNGLGAPRSFTTVANLIVVFSLGPCNSWRGLCNLRRWADLDAQPERNIYYGVTTTL